LINLCHRDFLTALKEVVVYEYKMETTVVMRDTTLEQMHYIFLADELQDVFPHLVSVYDTCDGGASVKKAIDYEGMVPILTGAIKEQQVLIEAQQAEIHTLQVIAQIPTPAFDLTELYELREMVEELQHKVNDLENQEAELHELREFVYYLRDNIEACGCLMWKRNAQSDSSNHKNNNNNSIQQSPVLYQNTPNPFSSNTEISCDVPIINNSAFIYIYNLQGVELMSFPIVQTGYSTVTVYAPALPAGMYLYTLVVDNEIIDTKRMILTK